MGISHLRNDGRVTDTLVHLQDKASITIGRATSKYSFSAQAQGVYEKNETYTNHATSQGQDKVNVLGRKTEFFKPRSSVRTDFGWTPTAGQKVSTFLSYDYGFDHSDNSSVNLLTDAKDLFFLKTALENSQAHQHTASAGWESSHWLGLVYGVTLAQMILVGIVIWLTYKYPVWWTYLLWFLLVPALSTCWVLYPLQAMVSLAFFVCIVIS